MCLVCYLCWFFSLSLSNFFQNGHILGKKMYKLEKNGPREVEKNELKNQWMLRLVRGYEGEFEYNAEFHELRAVCSILWWCRLVSTMQFKRGTIPLDMMMMILQNAID